MTPTETEAKETLTLSPLPVEIAREQEPER
jgi:hypothetical protein